MEHDVRAMLDVAETVHPEGEPLTTEDLDLHEIDGAIEAIRVWRAAQRQLAAAKAVLDVAGTRVAQLIGEGGAAAIGDTIVRYRQSRTERCIDPAGAIAFITHEVKGDRVDLGDIVNPNYLKRSWMDEATRQTFYEWVEDPDPSLTVISRDRAPKFLQALEDGEVLYR